MPGDFALIVDNSPVSLRLAEMVLRKGGYRVQTARDAEQALALLCGGCPDVVLVAGRLPGMDGLELTRCIKADVNTRAALVLAMIAAGAAAEEKAALEAGCAGVIPTPIDPRTLGKTVRAYLESAHQAPAPAAPQPLFGGLVLTDYEMEALRRRFLEDGISKAQSLLDSVGPAFDGPMAGYLLRRWTEGAGSLGYAEIAEAARRAEEWSKRQAPDAEGMRETLTELFCAFASPREAACDPLPNWVTAALSGKRIGLTAFRADEAERLCAALDRAGARPRLFDAGESPVSQPVRDCNLAILELSEATISSRWLAPGVPANSGRPLIVAGSRRQVMALDAAAQSCASDFLIDGWQPEEALLRCALAMARAASRAPAERACSAPVRTVASRSPGAPAEIVIADDDAIVRCLLRTTLEDYGMNCRVASDGHEALDMIRGEAPDAAVLDINMPGMDGYLVLSAIREEKIPVPVLLLTARNHENDISRGFTLGADDYLVKPFSNVELIARLRRMIRR